MSAADAAGLNATSAQRQQTLSWIVPFAKQFQCVPPPRGLDTTPRGTWLQSRRPVRHRTPLTDPRPTHQRPCPQRPMLVVPLTKRRNQAKDPRCHLRDVCMCVPQLF